MMMLLLFLVSLLCGSISLAVLWLSADAELITVELLLFSYDCLALLHFSLCCILAIGLTLKYFISDKQLTKGC